MAKIEVQNLVLGMAATNCYFVKNKETLDLLLVDPGDDFEAIRQKMRKMEAKPAAILLTHGHFDHMMAAKACSKAFHIPSYAHELEQEVLKNAAWNLSRQWMKDASMEADQTVKDMEKLHLAGFDICVLHTPGHTRGSVCYYLESEQILFSGDTLFQQSYGRTDFPTSSMCQMHDSINRILKDLPGETVVYPGHGESTTIAMEKRYNPLAGHKFEV